MPPQERRTSYRLPFISPFVCRPLGMDSTLAGTLNNVSITGCWGILEGNLAIDTECELQIIFQGDHSRLNVEAVRGRIVRSTHQGIAVHFAQRLEWFVLIPLFYNKICGKPFPLAAHSSRR